MDFVYLFVDVFELAYRHGRDSDSLEIATFVVSTFAAVVSALVLAYIGLNFRRELKNDQRDRDKATIDKLEGYVRFVYDKQKGLYRELRSYSSFINERNIKRSENPEIYGYIEYEGERVLIGDFLIRTEAIAILVNSDSLDLLTLNKFIGDYLRQVYSKHVKQLIEYEQEDDETSRTETQKMLDKLTRLR